MRKFLCACIMASCFVYGCAKVEPGYVGIKVYNWGSQKGVNDFPAKTGLVFFNPFTTDVYKFPTFLQTVVWTKEATEGSPDDDSVTFNSVEGAIVNVDIAVSYSFVSEKIPALFVEFRQDARAITHIYMRSQVRDTLCRLASKMKVVDIFGEQKQQLLDDAKKHLNELLGPKGFNFDMLSFVGAMRVDDKVEQSINAVIFATQKAIEAENKVRQSEAEAKQAIAVADGKAQSILKVAEAQAQANKLVALSVTPTLVQWQALEKWDGVLPKVTGGAMPFISVGSVEKEK